MTRRKASLYLSDILESIDYIEKFLQNVDEQEFYKNTEKQDAVLRRLEVIGEAVKHLPQEIRDKYSDIPWRRIAGMRDVIIHQYFGITLNMIWLVATSDIPMLKPKIKNILEQET